MENARRPIRARSVVVLQKFAAWLARTSVTPNQISVFSVVCAAAAGAALAFAQSPWCYLLAALGIQGRLLCNVIDGLVAVEGHKKSALGALYNEFPDRIADSLIIVGAGYAAGMPWLGWLGALLAALTAYVRTFGASLGLPADFRGPMAKQHRMAVLTAGCLVAAANFACFGPASALTVALGIVAAGSALTCWTRTAAIARNLNNPSD